MLILSAADVRRALPMPAAIEAMRHAFGSLEAGRVLMPPRIHMDIERHQGVSLLMGACIDDDHGDASGGGEALAVKVVNLFSGNTARGLPLLHAAVLVFEPDTGRPLALLEGASLTAIRTAAACGLATDILARPDARTLAIFGAGVQARTQLLAMSCVRPIETVRIYDPVPGRAEALIAEQAGPEGITAEIQPAADPAGALAGADIVCCATTATAPVFDDACIREGTHINAIGSYQPHVREVPAGTVARAAVFVDSKEAALAEAGDLIQPIENGIIDESHILAELGQLVTGRKGGRTDARQVTLFKSVGLAVQEAAAARAAVVNARREGLGTTVHW